MYTFKNVAQFYRFLETIVACLSYNILKRQLRIKFVNLTFDVLTPKRYITGLPGPQTASVSVVVLLGTHRQNIFLIVQRYFKNVSDILAPPEGIVTVWKYSGKSSICRKC